LSCAARRALIVCALALIAIPSFLTAGKAADVPANAYSGDTWTNQQQVYAKVCAYCHETGIGPKIKGRKLPAEYVRYTVRHGKQAMPAFRQSDIDDAMLQRVAVMISTSPVSAPASAPASASASAPAR
jgi:mono/diheme cytochrome c family protein